MKLIMTASFNDTRPAWLRASEAVRGLVTAFLVVEESDRLACVDAGRYPWPEPPPVEDAVGALGPGCVGAAFPTVSRSTAASFSVYGVALLSAFTRFAELDALQKLLLRLCSQVTEDAEVMGRAEPVPWYHLFFALDVDQDGALDFAEFSAGVFELLGDAAAERVSEARMAALFRTLDLDGNGMIEWTEWMALALSCSPDLVEGPEPCYTVFRILDAASVDGTVDCTDLVPFFTAADSEAASQLVQRWQDDGIDLLAEDTRKSDEAIHSVPGLSVLNVQRALAAAVQRCPQESPNAV